MTHNLEMRDVDNMKQDSIHIIAIEGASNNFNKINNRFGSLRSTCGGEMEFLITTHMIYASFMIQDAGCLFESFRSVHP